MWRPGLVGAKDGFMMLFGDFKVVMAPVAGVLVLAIGSRHPGLGLSLQL